jgi:hypothetical protein
MITESRITRFCRDTLDWLDGRSIEFVDVGSGGDLKAPWKLLPADRLSTFSFEPTGPAAGKAATCISNATRTAPFFVARDERASSLHKPIPDFVERYGFAGMITRETITVQCTSLDEQLAGRYEAADAIDVNVEGHDLQVLQGADRLLSAGAVKLLKVEFELVAAYEGQGYFSDIDAFLRAREYRLGDIEIEHVRPARVRHLHHRGEPLWGKALYAPTAARLRSRFTELSAADGPAAPRRELAAAIALYTAARLPGYADDAIMHAEAAGVVSASDAAALRAGLAGVFHWSRHETGLRQAWALITSIVSGVLRRH